MNEVVYQGRPLNSNVKDDNPDLSKRKHTRVNALTVFINNLDTSLEEPDVLSMCDDLLGPGSVVSLQLPTDLATGRMRGMAYIEFASAALARRALAELHGLEVLGKVLACVPFQPRKVVAAGPASRHPAAQSSES